MLYLEKAQSHITLSCLAGLSAPALNSRSHKLPVFRLSPSKSFHCVNQWHPFFQLSACFDKNYMPKRVWIMSDNSVIFMSTKKQNDEATRIQKGTWGWAAEASVCRGEAIVFEFEAIIRTFISLVGCSVDSGDCSFVRERKIYSQTLGIPNTVVFSATSTSMIRRGYGARVSNEENYSWPVEITLWREQWQPGAGFWKRVYHTRIQITVVFHFPQLQRLWTGVVSEHEFWSVKLFMAGINYY